MAATRVRTRRRRAARTPTARRGSRVCRRPRCRRTSASSSGRRRTTRATSWKHSAVSRRSLARPNQDNSRLFFTLFEQLNERIVVLFSGFISGCQREPVTALRHPLHVVPALHGASTATDRRLHPLLTGNKTYFIVFLLSFATAIASC